VKREAGILPLNYSRPVNLNTFQVYDKTEVVVHS
jgi:hypothetical protein